MLETLVYVSTNHRSIASKITVNLWNKIVNKYSIEVGSSLHDLDYTIDLLLLAFPIPNLIHLIFSIAITKKPANKTNTNSDILNLAIDTQRQVKTRSFNEGYMLFEHVEDLHKNRG